MGAAKHTEHRRAGRGEYGRGHRLLPTRANDHCKPISATAAIHQVKPGIALGRAPQTSSSILVPPDFASSSATRRGSCKGADLTLCAQVRGYLGLDLAGISRGQNC